MIFYFNTIKYEDKMVLNKGSFIYNYGMVTAISGKSGSGKTSLFRHIIHNNNSQISTLPQNYVFIDDLTIQEHIEIIQKLTGRILSKIDDYITMLKIQNLLDKYPSQLSGGEQHRVSFLLCLCESTDIIILDEPTASLNVEYSLVYQTILDDLKTNHKAIIIFTHDQCLFDYADIQYHIQDYQLQLKNDGCNIDDDIKIYNHTDIDIKAITKILFNSRKHFKLSKKIILVVLSIATAIAGIGFSLSQFIYNQEQLILSKMVSNEIIVYKASPHAVFENGDLYTFGTEIPFSQEDIKTIENIKHIDCCEWRVDLVLSDMSNNLDITHDDFNISDDLSCNIKLWQGQKELGKIDVLNQGQSGSVTISSYIDNKKSENDIKKDFKNKGIYISNTIAIMIEKELGISEDDLSELNIELDIPVPIYNTYGRWQGILDNGDMQFIYNTTVAKDTISLPVAGVLYESSLGLYNSFTEAFYIERDVYADLIQKHQVTADRKLYVIDADYQNYFVDNVPEEYKGEFNRIFDDRIWTYTAVSVYADGVENMPEIINELKNEGYCVNNQFFDFQTINSGLQSMQEMIKYISIFMGIIVLLFSFGVLYNDRRRNKNMTLYFKQLGLNNGDVYKIKAKYHLTDTFIELLKVVVLSIVIYSAFYINDLCFTPSFISIIFIILFILIIHFLLPLLNEKRMLNDFNKESQNKL